MAKRLNLLRKAQQSAGELGGAVFEYFLSLVEHERYTQSVNCLHVYNQAFDYIESQRASFDEGQEQASRKAEYYLKEKIEPAIQIVRSKPVGKLSPRDLGLLKTAQQHIEQLDIDIDEFKELSKQLTLAKNILKGGARLDKANGQQDPKLQSDELYGLSVEDGSQRLLSPAEIGIIIAILNDKFNDFREIYSNIHAPKTINELERLVKQRSEIAKEIQQFDLSSALNNILELLNPNQLGGVFHKDEINKILTAIRGYFEIDDSAGPVQSEEGAEENILGENELYTQLDWTIFPPGEEDLIKLAEEVEIANEGRDEIDLSRLLILKNIRDEWGADKCYFARGKLNSRKIKDNENDRPDQYIVLVMQEIDSGGKVSEHAIAESPLVGHNALYVFRADVSEGFSWRDVFSLPKKDAREFGARPVKHTKGGGGPLVDEMTTKVRTLLCASPEEFKKIQFQGSYVSIAKKLGKTSIDKAH